jgi:hypothetical protein
MRPLGFVGAALVVVAAGVAALAASCGGAPTPAPIRTFLQPQKVDFVCLNVNDANGNPIPPVPAPQSQCQPVPPNVSGNLFAFHEYALVTQTLRGELAVVDLTMGVIVDEDRSQPNVNFIPVGANPTDVAVSPDATHTYVTSADPSIPAVYGIDNHSILGDSEALSTRLPPLNNFSQITACRLPQLPDAVAVIPLPAAADAGAPVDGGGGSSSAPAYALAVLLRSQGPGVPAQVAVIEPPTVLGGLAPCTVLGMSGALSSSLAGASSAPGPAWSDGVVFADAGDLAETEPPVVPPGAISVCPATAVPQPMSGSVVDAGTGVPGVADASPLDAAALSDGGSDAQATADVLATSDAQPDVQSDGALVLDAGEDSNEELSDAQPAPAPADAAPMGAMAAGPGPGQGTSGLSFGPLSDPRPTSMVFRDGSPPVVYVADATIPVIHVIDLSNPTQPREASEFIATSQAQPNRRVSVGSLALSPTTRDYRRYLYAIDTSDGSLMVFDVTDPIPAPFSPPLQRPHAELNPFVPPDRISFTAPVAAVSFAYNEWPLPPQGDAAAPALTGLLCNPSPNARPGPDGSAPGGGAAAGSFYCADQAALINPDGTLVQGFPDRLRGWFGFAVLTNGMVAVIDLDDWDAPCRRPDPMTASKRTGDLDLPELPESDSGPPDLDPYHVPTAWPASLDPNATVSAVTQEPFYPVSAPNRPRSNFLLRNDPTSGEHIPYVLAPPLLSNSNGAPLSADPTEPVMLQTVLPSGFVDPSTYTTPTDPHDYYFGTPPPNADAAVSSGDAGDAGTLIPSLEPGSLDTVPGVRVSFDDPTAHIDQDWWVTYEGALPTTSPLVANIFSTTSYEDLTFSLGGAPSSVAEAGTDASVFASGGGFCEIGVEDWSLGQARAKNAVKLMLGASLPGPASFPQGAPLQQWTSDYVEITDNILPANDCYWQENLPGQGGLSGGCVTGSPPDSGADAAAASTGSSCDWAEVDKQATGVVSGKDVAQKRYNVCTAAFGPPDTTPNGPYSQADNYLLRDFPIVEAYDDHLVVTRFEWNPGESSCPEHTTNRSVFGGPNQDGRDPSNQPYFALAQCCFHNQAGFKIRTGGEWAVVGQTGLGFLHHVQPDSTSGRCVLSCDQRDVLRNGRAFDIPYGQPGAANQCVPPTAQIDRANALAFRNPMFSFAMWQGCSPQSTDDAGSSLGLCQGFGDHTTSQRDLSWRFSMRGGFTPLTFALGGVTDAPVVPQSVRPLPAFQQLAIVDGAQQGLILIDLHTLQFAHTPYF